MERNKPTLKELEEKLAIETEKTGGLKVLIEIQSQFSTISGDIHIPRKEWMKFSDPYFAKK